MSCTQFHCIKMFILRHAWLNLWDKHMTTGRINQVTSIKWTRTRTTERTDTALRIARRSITFHTNPRSLTQTRPKTGQRKFMIDIKRAFSCDLVRTVIKCTNNTSTSNAKMISSATPIALRFVDHYNQVLRCHATRAALNILNLLELFLERRWARQPGI
jgi:hypothetical protein